MNVAQNLRNRRFQRMIERLGLDPRRIQKMIEDGWRATIETTGVGCIVILHREPPVRITVPDGRAAAEWAAEFNRRVTEIHTPR